MASGFDELFQFTFEHSRDAIACSRTGRLFLVNDAFRDLFGYASVEEIVGLTILDMVVPECREQMQEIVRRRDAGATTTETYETRGLHKDGTTIDVSVQSSTLVVDGELTTLSFVRDVTAAHGLERSSRQASDLLDALVESTVDMIWSVDPVDFGLQWFNSRLDDYFLASRNLRIAVGMTPHDLLPTEELACQWDDWYRRALADGAFTTLYRVVAGSRWLEMTFSPVLSQGRVIGISVFGRDVTAAQEAEQRLEASELRFRALSENSLSGIYILEGGALVYTNPTMERILGYGPGELVGVPATSLFLPEDQPKIAQEIRERLTGVPSRPGLVFRILRKDGGTVWAEVFGSQAELDGCRVIIGNLLDVTDRVNAEARVQQDFQDLRKTFHEIIDCLSLTVEMRDPYTKGHQKRVSELAVAIARRLALPSEQVESIRVAGMIHDIGKLSIPAEILSKPRGLSDMEYALIREHVKSGYLILRQIEFPWPVADIVRQHHERLDGSGYPQGLSGDAICLEARILAVADVVEAMSSHRPYRPALGIDVALAEIVDHAGRWFDPVVGDACRRLFVEDGFDFESEGAL